MCLIRHAETRASRELGRFESPQRLETSFWAELLRRKRWGKLGCWLWIFKASVRSTRHCQTANKRADAGNMAPGELEAVARTTLASRVLAHPA